jgi:plastocyanin
MTGMTTTATRGRLRVAPRVAAALVVAALVALAALVAAPPAQAARTVDVVLSAQPPAEVALAPGDSVRFLNGETGALAPPHTVRSTEGDGSTAWQYGPVTLNPGQTSEPVVFPGPGTYLFTDRRGGPAPLGSEQVGRIVVTAPPPPPAPAPAPDAGPAAPPPAQPAPPATQPAPPAAQPAPPAAQPAPAAPAPPAAQPGAGSADLAPLLIGREAAPLGPIEGEAVAPPAIADLLGDAQQPAVAAPRPGVAPVAGPLPGFLTSRGLGLPTTLAALAALGVASLIVRVLLAEPTARPRGPAPATASAG